MVTTDKVDPGILDEIPNTCLLQMIDLVMIRSTKLSTETPILVCDDDTAATS